MSKAIPAIQKYMTPAPHTIGAEQTLESAASVMAEHEIRHLPVLSGGRLVGMLTERDIALVESIGGVERKTTQVADAMSADVYAVSPDTPLDEVTGEMARQKYGSVVVMQNNKVVGVVTTVDICRALSELLRSRLT